MLVLSRKKFEKIFIGDDVTLTVVELNETSVKIGIEAPISIPIVRDDCNSTVKKHK